MILQGSLRIDYNEDTYNLMVKTFLKNNVYYFFISDKEKGKSLLDGETVELTYADSFCSPGEEKAASTKKVPEEIIGAIQKMLMENKELWYY